MKSSSRLFNAMRRFMRLNAKKQQKKAMRPQKAIKAKEFKRAKSITPAVSTESKGNEVAKAVKDNVKAKERQKKLEERQKKIEEQARKKAEREAKRRERITNLQDTLNKRYEKLATKYAIPVDEVIAEAGDIQGVSLSEDGKSIIIDPEKASAESIRSLKATLPSEIAIKKEIAKEVGATDAKAISKEKMRKAIQKKLFYDKEDSIFTKYYDYFEKKDHRGNGGGPKDTKKFSDHPSAYSKASDYMTELGREVQKNGFTDDYRDLKEKIENLFAEIDGVKTDE